MGALDGQIAVVTGASHDVGEYISVRFGAEGATVVCTSRTVEPGSSPEPGSLRETVARIEKLSGKAVAVRCDVCDPASRAAVVAEVLERFGQGITAVVFPVTHVETFLAAADQQDLATVNGTYVDWREELGDLAQFWPLPRTYRLASRETLGFDIELEES